MEGQVESEPEPLSTGEWIGLLHSRLNDLEETRSEVVKRALTFAGAFFVASGVIFSFLDLPSLSLVEVRAVASLWLIIGFGSTSVALLLSQRIALSATKASIEDIAMLSRETAPVLVTMAALFLSGMVMGVVLVGGVYLAGASLGDIATLVLVILAEVFGLLFAVVPLGMRRSLRSDKGRQTWAKQQARISERAAKRGGYALGLVCLIGMILAVWSFGNTIGFSQLGLRGVIQIVGAGYVTYGSLVGLFLSLRNGAEILGDMSDLRKLLYETLEAKTSSANIRARYATLLRQAYETQDLITKYYSSVNLRHSSTATGDRVPQER